MLPSDINYVEVIADFKRWGWLDREIEDACFFRRGYVPQLRGGHIQNPPYEKAARLYNLWWSELTAKGLICALPAIDAVGTR